MSPIIGTARDFNGSAPRGLSSVMLNLDVDVRVSGVQLALASKIENSLYHKL